jgi:hypothetical protein
MRKAGSRSWAGFELALIAQLANRLPEKVNARPGEDRAFEQFLAESVMVGETTFGRSRPLQLRPLYGK